MKLTERYDNTRRNPYLINVYIVLNILLDNINNLQTGLCSLIEKLQRENKITDVQARDIRYFIFNNKPSFADNIVLGNITILDVKQTLFSYITGRELPKNYFYKSGNILFRKKLLKYYISEIGKDLALDRYNVYVPYINKYISSGKFVDSAFEARKFTFKDIFKLKEVYQSDIELHLCSY